MTCSAMREADSIAVDPHKWLYAPLEAGCALVRDSVDAARRLRVHAGLLSLRQRRRSATAELLRVRPAELPRLPRAEGVAGVAAGGAARLRGDDRRGHPPVARAVRPGGRASGAGGGHPGTEHHDVPVRSTWRQPGRSERQRRAERAELSGSSTACSKAAAPTSATRWSTADSFSARASSISGRASRTCGSWWMRWSRSGEPRTITKARWREGTKAMP